jgi:hypothetical protein
MGCCSCRLALKPGLLASSRPPANHQLDRREVEAARERLAKEIELILEHCETSAEPLTFPLGAAFQRNRPDLDAVFEELRSMRARQR